MTISLFQPFRIGKLELKNRFVMTGLGTGLPGPDGSVTDEYVAYMEERAKGGVGLLITEVVRPCDGHGLTARYQLSAAHDFLIPGIKRLVDAVHGHGAKIFLQLHHPGRETFDEILNGVAAVAPSAIPCPVNKATTREITAAEITELVRQFGEAAARIKSAGADGVELHGAHGYLFHQFLSPWTNRRTDGYGGNFENRFRFTKEVIESIRKTCGNDFPVAVRFPMEDFMGDKGIDIELGVRIARRLEKQGVDLLDATVGFYETSISNMLETASHYQGWRNALLKRLAEENFATPVVAVNSTRSLPFAEWMVEQGMVDLVGMGRPFLADPAWVNKAQAGKSEDIRPCLSCVYCVESLRHNAASDDERNTCAVNARTFKETKFTGLSINGGGKKVAVVGAGPAGLECACTLAQRGYAVDLFEKDGRIGGQLNTAARPENKYRIDALVQYYQTMLRKNGVTVHLNTDVAAAGAIPAGAGAVIVSTGSDPVMPASLLKDGHIPVYSPDDILSGKALPRNSRVAVVGSGLTGLETAEYLASRSNVVLVFDMLDEIGKDVYFQNKEDILHALERYAVNYFPSHKLLSVTGKGIVMRNLLSEEEIEFALDAVVLSLGRRANTALYDKLKSELSIPVVAIGDAVSVGRIKDAIHAGYTTAYNFK